MGIHKMRIELTRPESFVVDGKTPKIQGRVNACDLVFIDGSDAPFNGCLTVGGVHHKLRQHGIVMNRDFLAFFDPVVHAYTGTRWRRVSV